MKKVIILIDQFHSHGGIEKLVALKANYWAEKWDWDVSIVSTEQHNLPEIYPLSDKVKRIDIAVNYYRELSFFHPKNLLKLIGNFRKIQKIVDNQKPDFILVASHIPMTYLVPFLNTKAKTIKEFHFSKYNINKNIKENIFIKVESRYDYLVVLSEEEKKFYTTKNVEVIPNPVEKSARNFVEINSRPNVVIAALRFAPVKQLDKMIDAWEIFHKKNSDYKLYLFGTVGNDYHKEIKELVDKKNLSESVIFKGQSNNIEDELANAKFLLLTSKNECFPVVILEANACGTPVVSFNSPTGPRNIIHHQIDGLLVEQDNVVKFAEAMDLLVRNPEILKKMSLSATQNAKNYTVDMIMDKWKNSIFES